MIVYDISLRSMIYDYKCEIKDMMNDKIYMTYDVI